MSLHPHPQDQQNQCRQRGTGSSLSAAAPSPAPGRTARGKKLFRYFSTFLTYLVKAADALIRIMSNVGASEHCGGGRAASAPCADPHGAAGACAPQNPRTPAPPPANPKPLQCHRCLSAWLIPAPCLASNPHRPDVCTQNCQHCHPTPQHPAGWAKTPRTHSHCSGVPIGSFFPSP